ncbi:MAG: hypothetical protein LBP79_01320 [Clostridiales bacterium]|jgi:hypothetical protein|nr:hypothetical protein [Clostridiales bacterium]
MADKTVKARVRPMTQSAAKWADSDVILMRGEMGVDITNNIIKIGNGTDLFKDLPVVSGSGGGITEIPLATAETVGGIKANAATDEDVTAINIDENGFLKTSAREGKSAYEVAVDDGFTGTEAEWLTSLRAQPGKGLTLLTQGDSEDYVLTGVNQSYPTWGDTLIKFPSGNTVSNRAFFIKMSYTGQTGTWGNAKSTVLNFSAWYAAIADGQYTPKIIDGSVSYDSAEAVTIPATLNYDMASNGVTVSVNLSQYLQAPTITVDIYEVTGQGIAPKITASSGNNDETYRLRIDVVGQPIFDTANLIGKQGARGAKGDKGDAAVLEAVAVTTADFSGGKIVIPYSSDAAATGILHHIGATSNIIAFRQIWDAVGEAWKTAIITADNVAVKENGAVTITDTPFEGKILLTSGSQYSTSGGGSGVDAEHKLLVENEDYTFSDGTSPGELGAPSITFTEALDVPLYAVHIQGNLVASGEEAIPVAANFTLKKVPFQMTVPIDEEDPPTMLSAGICDENFFTAVSGDLTALVTLSVMYMNLSGTEMWGYQLTASNANYTFSQNEIEIIKI